MDRRGFLRGLLGIAAGAALPLSATKFLAKNSAISDEAFREAAIINLLEKRIASARAMMIAQLSEKLFSEGTGISTL